MPAETRNKSDTYILRRDRGATSRLNHQYFLWQNTFRFMIAPGLPEPFAGFRVADVGTGSGLWLHDLALQVGPDVELVGLDISLHQLPPKIQRLPNMSFREWDFFQPPPDDLKATFDIVHLRLVAVIIQNNDPGKVLQNVKQLLKPGGYIQWEEHYTDQCKVDGVDPSQDASSMVGLGQLRDMLSYEQRGSQGQLLVHPRTWLSTLTDTLSEHGFEPVDGKQKLIYPDNPFMGKFWTDIYLQTVEEFVNQMLDRDPEYAQKLKAMVDAAQEEAQSGGWVSNPKGVFIGRFKG